MLMSPEVELGHRRDATDCQPGNPPQRSRIIAIGTAVEPSAVSKPRSQRELRRGQWDARERGRRCVCNWKEADEERGRMITIKMKRRN